MLAPQAEHLFDPIDSLLPQWGQLTSARLPVEGDEDGDDVASDNGIEDSFANGLSTIACIVVPGGTAVGLGAGAGSYLDGGL